MVPWSVLNLGRYLVLPGLGLLDAQDVRPVSLQPFKEAFLVDGSKAIHVPGENTNCGHYLNYSLTGTISGLADDNTADDSYDKAWDDKND